MKKKSLDEKIKDLFEYRLLPDMAKKLNVSIDIYPEALVQLQKGIFLYDKHLEKFENPSMEVLSSLWSTIESDMHRIGYLDEETSHLLRHIMIYAENELSTRKGLKLSSLPIKYFYYYKSCDVRLMRKILIDKGDKELGWKVGDWLIFDWVTEVNDDVTDVEEDMYTFNGNRYLESLRLLGWEKTRKEYFGFLEYCKDRCEEMNDRWIGEKVVENVRITKDFIDLHERILWE